MRSMRWGLTVFVLVLVSCGGGSSSTTSDASSTSTDTGVEDEYNVGDTGPGGGIVVYVNEAGFNNSVEDNESIGAMCLTGTCHYLEMAPTDVIGRYLGEEAIVTAEAFSTSSTNDWVLPSKDALNEICKFAFVDTVNDICNSEGSGGLARRLGGFSNDPYWSSSEFGANHAWAQDFDSGYRYIRSREFAGSVRPVRAF